MNGAMAAVLAAGIVGIGLIAVLIILAARGKARAVTAKDERAKPAKAERSGGSGKSGSGTKPSSRSAAGAGNKAEKKSDPLVPVQIKNHTDKKGGHPHVILSNVDDKHVSVGLSTKPKKGKNSTNYKLEISPLGDGKQSYMRRQGTVAPKGEYKQPRNGAMTKKDFAKAKEYGEKAKQKYLKEKEHKKK